MNTNYYKLSVEKHLKLVNFLTAYAINSKADKGQNISARYVCVWPNFY